MSYQGRTNLRCEVVPYRDALPEAARNAWKRLLPDLATPIFLHPEWMAMAIHTHAVDRGFVLIFREGEEPRAVLPFQYRTHWTAEICAPMGPDVMPFIIAPGQERSLWPALADWLRSSPFAIIRLGRYLSDRFEYLLDLTREEGLTPITRPAMPVLWVDLPDSWETYLQVLPKPSRYKIRHAEAKIMTDYPDAKIRLHTDCTACEQEVDALIRLSLLRWEHEKRRSVLENPHMAALLRGFTIWAVNQGYGCIASLEVGGQTVAVATGIHIPGQPAAYYHTVGRHPKALPPQYSPGISLAGRIIRWAIDRGATRLSLGQGYMPYKQVLGGEEYPQWELAIARSKLAAAIMGKVDPAIHFTRGRVMQLFEKRR